MPPLHPEWGLPAALIERLAEIYPPAHLERILARSRGSAAACFRVNTLRRSPAEAVAELVSAGLSPRPWSLRADAFSVAPSQRELLVDHPLVARGDIYLQNFSSMLAPHLLDPRPGEEVLDLAAAPGGKTLMMACQMCNTGRLAAVEPVKARYFRLQANLARAGVSIAHLYLKDGAVVGRQVPGRFDRVLLDAPCSSEARMTVVDPESWRYWSERKLVEMQRKQKQLLYSAVLALKPGGRLLYATCAFSPEENELVVSHVLGKFPGQLVVMPVTLEEDLAIPGLTRWRGHELNSALRGAARVVPNGEFSGFFLCLLQKRG